MGNDFEMSDYEYKHWLTKENTFWRKKFALWPHQSSYSGKCVWFKQAYKGIQHVLEIETGDVKTETYWVTDEEFILMTLKGDYESNNNR